MSLREPIHVFSIPPHIASSLSIRSGPGRNVVDPGTSSSFPEVDALDTAESESTASGSLACNICNGAVFSDVNEQRSHFRSDWHRYNVKAQLQKSTFKSVNEAEFAGLVQALDESLSGSASSSSDDEDDSDDAVSTLIQRQKKLLLGNDSPASDDEGPSIPRSPIVWFQSPEAPNTQLGTYTAVFPTDAPVESYAEALRDMQDGGEKGRSWALFMTAGGHFAGMIARVSKPGSPSPPDSAPEGKKSKTANKPIANIEILAHKTFHRYTTRRKQGGSQSVNDNAKGKAKSAGAQLRRYGEQSLKEDIRALLIEWADELKDCERIFIRASVSNRKIFLDGEDSPIRKGDARLRTFPFPTRRPTLSELTRCLQEITRVKLTFFTEDELKAADEAFLALLQSKRRQPIKPAKPAATGVDGDKKKKDVEKLSPDELALRERWSKIIEMVRKGRLDSLQTLWSSLSSKTLPLGPLSPESGASASPPIRLIDTRVPEWVREEDGAGPGATLLQLATAAGQEAIVEWLLVTERADPTLAAPATTSSKPQNVTSVSDDEDAPSSRATSSGVRKAYDLAATRGIRNIFRRSAYAYPTWWDWLGDGDGAHVPSVLSPEMEEADQRKKVVRRKGLKDRMKERDEAKKAEQEEKDKLAAAAAAIKPAVAPVAKRTGPQKLGGPGSGGGASAATLDAMSPEMRARIERERRARAAEARLRTLGGQ